MIFTCATATYWTEDGPVECERHGILCLRFDTKKTLLLVPRTDGSLVARPLHETPWTPAFVEVPVSAVTQIQDVNDSLRTRFSAALSGIVLPGKDAGIN